MQCAHEQTGAQRFKISIFNQGKAIFHSVSWDQLCADIPRHSWAPWDHSGRPLLRNLWQSKPVEQQYDLYSVKHGSDILPWNSIFGENFSKLKAKEMLSISKLMHYNHGQPVFLIFLPEALGKDSISISLVKCSIVNYHKFSELLMAQRFLLRIESQYAAWGKQFEQVDTLVFR